MTHRDELEALRARVESQENDLRDARAELDVLRAAVHKQAMPPRDPADVSPPPGAMGFGPGAFPAPTAPRIAPSAAGRRQLALLVFLSSLLVSGLVFSASLGHRTCGTRGGRAYGPPPGAMATPPPAGAAWSPFVRFGHVVSPGDPVAVEAGSACSVEVTPAFGGRELDCRISVRCGERLIYGTDDMTGFAHCGAVPSFVVDEHTSADDGDPAMTLDLASGRVTVEERVGLSIQTVEIQLDPL